MSTKSVAIVGVGPGNGLAFARRFATAGARVALISRDAEACAASAATIDGAVAAPFDATDAAAAAEGFARIKAEIGPIDTLLYNASARSFGAFEDLSVETIDQAYAVSVRGLWLAAEAVLPDMTAAGAGAIVVSGATAALRGMPMTAAFAPAKAGARMLAQSLARAYGPKGVHVAHVIIDGIIDRPASRERFPDKTEDDLLAPDAIAEALYQLTQQPRSAWTFELDLRPYGERW